MTRKELQSLAKLRLKEAQALFDRQLYDGCVYLCGYVLELALKARICKLLGIKEYPEEQGFKQSYKTHDFSTLKTLAGLDSKLTATKAQLFANWSNLLSWKPEIRYEKPGTYTRAKAETYLESLVNKPDGVLTWLMKRW